jgi:hypothetical protein
MAFFVVLFQRYNGINNMLGRRQRIITAGEPSQRKWAVRGRSLRTAFFVGSPEYFPTTPP